MAVVLVASGVVAGVLVTRAVSAVSSFQSVYVRMPDGVRLAVDVWRPAGAAAGARLPTVLEADRYWRARAYSGGIKDNPDYQITAPWNERGYA
jgi:predicted acyl esterase